MTKTLLPRKTIAGNPELKAVLERVGFKTGELAAHILDLEKEVATGGKPDAAAIAAAVPENLTYLENECSRLQAENSQLRARLGVTANATAITVSNPPSGKAQPETTQLTGRARFAAACKIA